MKTKELYVVTIATYDGNDNYLDGHSEVFASETAAKQRVDELEEHWHKMPDVDTCGELAGVYGYVYYFLDEHIFKVKYEKVELK